MEKALASTGRLPKPAAGVEHAFAWMAQWCGKKELALYRSNTPEVQDLG